MEEMVICEKSGKPAYRLRPFGGEHALCYELSFWRDAYTDDKGKEHAAEWRFSRKYPSTVAHGLRLIAEDIERNGNWRAFAKANLASLRTAADEFEQLLASFAERYEVK